MILASRVASISATVATLFLCPLCQHWDGWWLRAADINGWVISAVSPFSLASDTMWYEDFYTSSPLLYIHPHLSTPDRLVPNRWIFFILGKKMVRQPLLPVLSCVIYFWVTYFWWLNLESPIFPHEVDGHVNCWSSPHSETFPSPLSSRHTPKRGCNELLPIFGLLQHTEPTPTWKPNTSFSLCLQLVMPDSP